ncbi:Hypothetical protein FKW44_007770, partial [Caligus rogercresseyi]
DSETSPLCRRTTRMGSPGNMNPGGEEVLVSERQSLHRERHVLFCKRQAFLFERHVHEMKDVLDSNGWNLC